MRQFLGSVILEGLSDLTSLSGWTPLLERVVEMPADPDATLWHVYWYRLDEADLKARLNALAAATRPHWYAHFWSGDDLVVILAGRAFWIKASDKATWQEMVRYGDAVGIERKWTESFATNVPAYLQAALDQG